MKKILFVLNTLTFGGAEKQTVQLINQLDRSQFAIDLFYFEKIEALLPLVDKNRLGRCRCLNKKRKFDLSVLAKCMKHLSRTPYDMVICVNAYALIYIHLCKLILRKSFNVIAICHTTIPLPGVWTRMKNTLYRNLFNRCDRIIYVCENQKKFCENNYRIDTSLTSHIYNGVDTSYFCDTYSSEEKEKLKISLGFGKNDCIAGICAVLRPEKKHTDFIDAIEMAINKGNTIKGLLIGDGPQRAFIEAYICQKGLSGNIVIAGFQEDVRPFISICDMMVLASHSVETFSIAVLESMSMGKPMIITDIGGASEQIDPGVNGFLYEKGDTARLSEYMTQLINPEIRKTFSMAARETVEGKFSIEKMVLAYEEQLTEIARKMF